MLRPSPIPNLFPYTTLFRSGLIRRAGLRRPFRDAHGSRRPPLPRRHRRPGAEADGASHGHRGMRSEEHTSELQSLTNLVCRLLLEKKKKERLMTINAITQHI